VAILWNKYSTKTLKYSQPVFYEIHYSNQTKSKIDQKPHKKLEWKINAFWRWAKNYWKSIEIENIEWMCFRSLFCLNFDWRKSLDSLFWNSSKIAPIIESNTKILSEFTLNTLEMLILTWLHRLTSHHFVVTKRSKTRTVKQNKWNIKSTDMPQTHWVRFQMDQQLIKEIMVFMPDLKTAIIEICNASADWTKFESNWQILSKKWPIYLFVI